MPNRVRPSLSAAVDGLALGLATVALGLLLLWWMVPILIGGCAAQPVISRPAARRRGIFRMMELQEVSQLCVPGDGVKVLIFRPIERVRPVRIAPPAI